jgi:hypothetical protein
MGDVRDPYTHTHTHTHCLFLSLIEIESIVRSETIEIVSKDKPFSGSLFSMAFTGSYSNQLPTQV